VSFRESVDKTADIYPLIVGAALDPCAAAATRAPRRR
jgi:hypothetical protein